MNSIARRLTPAFVLLLLASGCAAPAQDDLGTPVTLSGDAGAVDGLVINDELMPVGSAEVRIAELDRVVYTDGEGGFWFDGVPAGTWTLKVAEPRHIVGDATVTVEPDETADVRITLATIPGVSPYRSTRLFVGSYDCAHEVPTWTGDCMILYEAATGEPDETTNESFAFRLPIGDHWSSVVLELEWTAAANNQLDGMRLYLENANGTDIGHSYKVGRVDGPASPLRLTVHRGVPDPRADVYEGTQTPAFIPDEGEDALVRVFPRGHFYDQTQQVCDADGKCFLGFGAGLDIRFTVYATVFYVDPAPASFTAMPDQ